MKTAIVYSSVYLKHKPYTSHPENPRRLSELISELKERGILHKIPVIEPIKVSVEYVEYVHDREYIELIRDFCKKGGGFIDPDTYLCEDTFDVALYAVGGVLKAIDEVVKGTYNAVFCLIRPPGHHAGKLGRALGAPTQGFCIFNNVAIGAMVLTKDYGIERVAIIDFDCHHGNGTQEIFYYSRQVLYLSTHQDPRTIYPGTGYPEEVGEDEGEGYNINIPLPPYSGDDIYYEVVDDIVVPIIEQFKPNFILVSAGYDAHRRDPITSMNLSVNSFNYIVKKLVEVVRTYMEPRLVLCLEGGYGVGLKLGVYTTLTYLIHEVCKTFEESTTSDSITWSYWRKVKEKLVSILTRYWSL